jgi:hypothetical protein
MATMPLSRSFKANFLIYFLRLIVVEGFVCFLNDVLINEDKIDELEVEEEGTKNINNHIILF